MENFDVDKYNETKFIFVVGIGGSDLASKAVWNAMTLHKPEIKKKIFFLEAPDAREYEEVKNIIESEAVNLKQILLVAVSKSGETRETLEAFNKIFDILNLKFGPFVNERVLIVSSPQTSLWQLAEEKNIEKLEWEKDVGGRFSAFTTPHLAILSIAELDTSSFVAGGKEMAKECEEKRADNQSKKLAKDIFKNYKNSKNILDFFFFNSALEDLGKWCRQLIAESLAAITPTVSLGPTDLHSMLELYLGGPKDRFTVFIRSIKEIHNSPNESAFENVTAAYEKAKLPFFKYEMPEINEKELGKFMAFMMETTLYLAEMLKVDPYDQPAVEEYKHQITNSK